MLISKTCKNKPKTTYEHFISISISLNIGLANAYSNRIGRRNGFVFGCGSNPHIQTV
jgi:hypothetical protein